MKFRFGWAFLPFKQAERLQKFFSGALDRLHVLNQKTQHLRMSLRNCSVVIESEAGVSMDANASQSVTILTLLDRMNSPSLLGFRPPPVAISCRRCCVRIIF